VLDNNGVSYVYLESTISWLLAHRIVILRKPFNTLRSNVQDPLLLVQNFSMCKWLVIHNVIKNRKIPIFFGAPLIIGSLTRKCTGNEPKGTWEIVAWQEIWNPVDSFALDGVQPGMHPRFKRHLLHPHML
jgi:hypothetical protein